MVEMEDGHVLISGFLRKSPPETKFKVSSVSVWAKIMHSSVQTCMVRIDFKYALADIWLRRIFLEGFSYISISWVDSLACILDQYLFFLFIPRRIDRRSSKCWRILSQKLGETVPFRPFTSVCTVVLYGTSFGMVKLLVNASEKVRFA